MGKLVFIISVSLLAQETKRITIYPKEKPMHIEVPKEDMDVMVDCPESNPGVGISRKEMRHLEYILRGRKFKTDPNLTE